MGGRVDPEARNAYVREYRRRRIATDPAYVEKLRASSRAWNRENRKTEKSRSGRRAALLKHRYGLSVAEFEQMWADQGGHCLICKIEPIAAVDHNHHTGKVRGLLCHRCNVAIGLMHDSPMRLEQAAQYLRSTDGA